MREAVLGTKDPVKVAAGKVGAEKRWSDPANRTVVRIDSLSPAERALVLALVEAKKAAPGEAAPEAAMRGGHPNDPGLAS